MTTKTRTTELQRIMDAVGEHIIEASDDEIEEIFNELNIDSQEEAIRLSNAIKGAWASVKLSKLKEAFATYNVPSINLLRLPSDSNAQRALLDNLCSSKKDTPGLLLKFRNGDGKALSDRDVKSCLEDLDELDAIEER